MHGLLSRKLLPPDSRQFGTTSELKKRAPFGDIRFVYLVIIGARGAVEKADGPQVLARSGRLSAVRRNAEEKGSRA